ncbi:lycopene cyclase domain-containing protein [Flavitalea flava]
MRSLYLLIDFFTVIVPFLFSFHPRIKFYREWKAFFPATLLVALLFIIWDSLFTRLGVWHFNPRYVMGLYFWELPAEEILFFLCIPYSCVFTYFCLDYYCRENKINLAWKMQTDLIFCTAFSVLLLFTGFWFLRNLYTSVTFITTAILCLFLKFILKIDWFGKAVIVYALLMIPFFIVNGLLTGTGPDEPVVIYNNAENTGIRLLTIPVEDFVYGFELILLNLLFYKVFRRSIHKGFNENN